MTDNKIAILVDVATRSLKIAEGSLVLGVKGDSDAQRIYFKCPKTVNNIFDDLTVKGIKIYIDYKNAFKENYKQECSDVVDIISTDGKFVIFSWLVPYYATVKAGVVEFSVCIKKIDPDTGALTNEWHSGIAKGTVLEGNCNVNALEVIAPDTVTVEALTLVVADLKAKLQDTEEYINGEVETQVSAEMNQYNTRLDPVYVTGQSIFTTNLLNFDSFTMSFYVDKRNAENSITYFYQNSEAGKQGDICGFVSYAEITNTHNTYNMHYTIKGTRVANDFQGNMTYMIEFLAYDENSYDNEVALASNTLISVVDGVNYLGFSIDSTASNQYLVGRKF